MNVFITVNKQKLHCGNASRNLVAGTQEFILFTFYLSDDWENLTVYAQFTQNGVSRNVYLNNKHQAYLPPEIGNGKCTIALKGTSGNVIAISEPLELNLSINPIKNNAESTGITLTLYEQLVNKVDRLLSNEGLIADTTESILQGYLNSGQLAAMSISDNSITYNKLSQNSIATNDEVIEYLDLR